MRYLSSSSASVLKIVFPVVGIVGCAYFAVVALFEAEYMIASAAVGCALLVWVFDRLLVSNLAEQVIDLGSHLVVKRGLLKDRVSLAEIIEVNESIGISPPAITLRLARASKFGRLVSFTPVASSRFNPIAPHSLVVELRERSAAARAKNAG